MLKVLINEEEVVSNQNLTIDKQMLNTPSVILKNVCPKTWRDNNDYTTNFYHPQDYSKCKILDVTDIPAEPGSTIEGTSFTIPNNDNNKLHELTTLKGNTTQNGTPTPDNPVPVNVVSGGQDINVVGKNLFNCYKYPSNNELNGITITNNGDGSFTLNGTATADAVFMLGTANSIRDYCTTQNMTHTAYYVSGSIQKVSSSATRTVIRLNYNLGGSMISLSTLNSTHTKESKTQTQTTTSGWAWQIILGTGDVCNNFKIKYQLEKGNTSTDWEEYKGQSYEINLGKNLLRNDLSILQANNVGGTWTDNKYVLNGVEFTCNDNGSVSAKRIESSSSNAIFYISRRGSSYQYTTLDIATYYLTSHEETGSNTTWKMQYNAGSNINVYGTGNSKEPTLTLTESKSITATIIVYSGYDPNGATFYPMISKTQRTEYAPYKTPIELCKINDYQDFIRKGTGKNLFDKDNANILNNMYIDGTTSTIKSASGGSTLYIPCEINTTYTISKILSARFIVGTTNVIPEENVSIYNRITNNQTTHITITTDSNSKYLCVFYYTSSYDTLTEQQIRSSIMIELGSQATLYEPYGFKDKWYLYKTIGKVVLNGSESWTQKNLVDDNYLYGTPFDLPNYSTNYITTHFTTNTAGYSTSTIGSYILNSELRIRISRTIAGSTPALKTWLGSNNVSVYYALATPTTTEITDTELISQLEGIELLQGINNVSVSSGDLSGIITIHYNYVNASHTEDLLFCGVVKNSGNISLNPREPHYSTLQILDFKTFLSEGELDSFVIYQKTITEAIQMVIANIQDYGFVLGNIKILTPDDIIGAYSTKDKSAFDVFNYIADITQSRWTTRMIDENHVAIDFYDPTLMDEGTEIDYTQSFFENNKIDNMTYSYGSNNYRNKQVMTSSQVYSNISQTQSIVANGYQTQFNTEQPIGKINSITSNGIPLTFATFQERDMGYVADFYYQPGENYFESDDLRSTGEILIIDYVSIVEGRQVITNPSEINRINESTNRKGIVSRYEQRNDATTSMELQKIGETYIKYKGTPEIKLKISTRKNIWEVGERVKFNAPITELDTEYMVRTKKINYIASTETIFYDYELISSFNSETEINYFDNQRAKASGNIGEGEYISRNIDIESVANIIFYDTASTEVQVDGDNILDCPLNSPFTN